MHERVRKLTPTDETYNVLFKPIMCLHYNATVNLP